MGVAGGKPTPEQAEDLQLNYEAYCRKAAQAIKNADIFLLATGAGFSADSGLAVYKDIADVPAYHRMGVNYSDLCVPAWIQDDPEIFYGFWGMCFNDYRNTVPHQGYSIIRSWKEKYFNASTEVGRKLQQKTEKDRNHENMMVLARAMRKMSTDDGEKEEKQEEEPKSFKGPRDDLPTAGPFFIYTSNVDAHSQKAGFSPNEVHEIHGNTETWQCSRPCSDFLWEPPADFMFDINKDTMRAPSTLEKGATVDYKQHNGFVDNHPRCVKCGALARPCILMFGDGQWTSDDAQHTQYSNWSRSVKKMMRKNDKLRMVVVEIGAGIRVPSVRFQSQSWLRELPSGSCTLIRINPDFPINPDTTAQYTISLQRSGLEALTHINKHLEELAQSS